jgi:hypothetical protein
VPAAHCASGSATKEKLDQQNDHAAATEDTSATEKSEDKHSTPDAPMSKSNFISSLKSMYPGVDENFLSEKLGDNPDLDKVRSVAEALAMTGYPREDDELKSNSHSDGRNEIVEEERPKQKVLGSKKLGKAFSGLKASTLAGLPNRLKPHTSGNGVIQNGNNSIGGMAAPPTGKGGIVPPEADASLQSTMENMLENKVRQSPSIDEHGVQSEERTTSIPEVRDKKGVITIVGLPVDAWPCNELPAAKPHRLIICVTFIFSYFSRDWITVIFVRCYRHKTFNHLLLLMARQKLTMGSEFFQLESTKCRLSFYNKM